MKNSAFNWITAAATLTLLLAPARATDTAAKKEAVRLQKTDRLAPAGVGEHCVKLAVGQTVRYRFEADAAIDFNIHMHAGEQVINAVDQTAVAKTDFLDFKPERAADWCWMWTNTQSVPVAVRYTLFVSPPKRERRK